MATGLLLAGQLTCRVAVGVTEVIVIRWVDAAGTACDPVKRRSGVVTPFPADLCDKHVNSRSVLRLIYRLIRARTVRGNSPHPPRMLCVCMYHVCMCLYVCLLPAYVNKVLRVSNFVHSAVRKFWRDLIGRRSSD